jgi:hypothetical protein
MAGHLELRAAVSTVNALTQYECFDGILKLYSRHSKTCQTLSLNYLLKLKYTLRTVTHWGRGFSLFSVFMRCCLSHVFIPKYKTLEVNSYRIESNLQQQTPVNQRRPVLK